MAHGALLRQHSGDPEFASHVMHDYKKADLEPQTRGILDFTAKLTKNPTTMERSDVQALRDLGLSDEQVLSTVLITCVFNFMTRLADGLGRRVPRAESEGHRGVAHGPGHRAGVDAKAEGLGVAVGAASPPGRARCHGYGNVMLSPASHHHSETAGEESGVGSVWICNTRTTPQMEPAHRPDPSAAASW